jgi:hypothetical protein
MVSIGFGTKDIFIGVRHYTDRKKPCLVIERGNTGLVLGTFRNEEMTEEFEKALIEVFGEHLYE